MTKRSIRHYLNENVLDLHRFPYFSNSPIRRESRKLTCDLLGEYRTVAKQWIEAHTMHIFFAVLLCKHADLKSVACIL